MLFFRRKKREREPWPSWVKWALIGFLALAFLGNLHHKNAPDAPGTIPEALHKAAENLSPQKLLPLDTYKNSIFPRDETELKIKDTAPGEGTPAVCGQEVNIAYKAYAADDKPTGSGQTITFRIGEGKVMPALEKGVVGMKKGGKRSIFSVHERFETELLDATPAIPDAEGTPYRITITAAGSGPPILCGEPAKLQVTVWSIDGKKLFAGKDTGQPLAFTPGKSEVFLGLEQGIIGMPRGEMRTLVVPPAFQKTMNGNPPTIDFHLPKEQTVLVDVEAMP